MHSGTDGITLYDVIRFFCFRILDSEAGLHIFECEVELVIADLLGRAAEVRAAKHAKDMREAFVLSLEAEVLAGERGVLSSRKEQHRLQGGNVIREIVDRHVHAEQNRRFARRDARTGLQSDVDH